MANEQIKTAAKAKAEQVGEAIKAVSPAPEIHKEKVPQKIYVGPNIPGLPKYTVVESTKVPHVQEIIKKCAAVEKLFVAIDKMTETEARTANKGTLEHRHVTNVIEYINNGRNGGAN